MRRETGDPFMDEERHIITDYANFVIKHCKPKIYADDEIVEYLADTTFREYPYESFCDVFVNRYRDRYFLYSKAHNWSIRMCYRHMTLVGNIPDLGELLVSMKLATCYETC